MTRSMEMPALGAAAAMQMVCILIVHVGSDMRMEMTVIMTLAAMMKMTALMKGYLMIPTKVPRRRKCFWALLAGTVFNFIILFNSVPTIILDST